jgi:acylaminoacyl-peptidase
VDQRANCAARRCGTRNAINPRASRGNGDEDAAAIGCLIPLGTRGEDIPARLEAYQHLRKSRREFFNRESLEQATQPSKRRLYARCEYSFLHITSEKFNFTSHLGEGFAGKKRPTIFIFRWDAYIVPYHTSLATVSPIVPQDRPVLFSQPGFPPLDKHTIFATGYEYTRDGRLLGFRWCYNRPSGIWEVKLPVTKDETDNGSPASLRCASKKLTSSNLSCGSPRIYYDATRNAAKLFWLSCASGVPHAGTFSLHVSDLATREITRRVLVDTVWDPRESDGFPGLYLDANLQ